ncbi:MAG: class I SAM-dependent methyltransferase, partial [Candidatus Levyibacteriota bacterium]
YKQVDIEKDLPYPNNSFDFIFSLMVLHYVENMDHVATEFYRLLKSNGNLLFSLTHPLYELKRAAHLHTAEKRTRYSVVALNQTTKIEVYYEPYHAFIKHFLQAGFTLLTEKEIIVNEDFAIKYPRYKQFIGSPRAYIFKFSK